MTVAASAGTLLTTRAHTSVDDIPAACRSIQDCCQHLLVGHVVCIAQVRACAQAAQVQVRGCRKTTGEAASRPVDDRSSTGGRRAACAGVSSCVFCRPLLCGACEILQSRCCTRVQLAQSSGRGRMHCCPLTFLWRVRVLRNPCHPVEVIRPHCRCQRLGIQSRPRLCGIALEGVLVLQDKRAGNTSAQPKACR